MRRLNFGGLVLALLFAMGSPAILAMQATPEPQATPVGEPQDVGADELAYAPNDTIHGASLGEWSARYWQWVTSFPVGASPAHDPSGTLCGRGQNEPVFFVPRNYPPCTVPAGLAVLLPITGVTCSTLERAPYHGDDEDALAACAAAEADRYTNVTVRVDGDEVPEADAYRAASPVFTLSLPDDNILAVPEGTGKAVIDGHLVILRPLSPGTHQIVVHVEATEGYVLPDKTLVLTVAEPVTDE